MPVVAPDPGNAGAGHNMATERLCPRCRRQKGQVLKVLWLGVGRAFPGVYVQEPPLFESAYKCGGLGENH